MSPPRVQIPSLRAFLGSIACRTSTELTRLGLPLLDGGLTESDIAVRDAVNAAAQGVAIANVRMFGAKGDGIADDSPRFKDAIDAAIANQSGIVIVPPGFYKFSSGITIPSAVTLTGLHGAPPGGLLSNANAFPTLLKAFDGDLFTIDYGSASAVHSSGGGFEGLRMVQGYQSGGGGTPRGKAIHVKTTNPATVPSWFRVRKCTIEDGTTDPWEWAMYFDGNVANQTTWLSNFFVSEVHTHVNYASGGALYLNSAAGVIVDACQFHLVGGRIFVDGNAAKTAVVQTGSGPTVTITDTPGDAGNPVKNVVIKITTGGALGVGQFAVSYDGGSTYGAPATLGATASINTHVTGNFAAGTYVLNTTYAFTEYCFPSTEISFTGCTVSHFDLDRVADVQYTGGAIGAMSTTASSGKPYGGTIRVDPGQINGGYSTNVDATFNPNVHATYFNVNATPESYEKHSRPSGYPNNTVALYGEAVAAPAIGIVKIDANNGLRIDPAGAAAYYMFGSVTDVTGVSAGDILLPNSCSIRGKRAASSTIGLITLDGSDIISIGHGGEAAWYTIGHVVTVNSAAAGEMVAANLFGLRAVNHGGTDTFGLVESTYVGSLDTVTIGNKAQNVKFGTGVADAFNTVTYSATMAIDATLGNAVGIRATDGSAFTISTPTSPVVGQRLTFVIFNDSGGALGAVTWGAGYLLAGSWTSPANGKRRTIAFVYDAYATKWVEISRAAADII